MRRKGFTLVELMVAVGVLTLLAAMAMPVLAKARKQALRTRMKSDLMVLSQGLDAYRADQRDYPRNIAGKDGWDIEGSELLCWALIAPGSAADDGCDGPGFRIRGTKGQVYGPYVNPDLFKLSSSEYGDPVILDRQGQQIYYVPANQGVDIHAPGGFIDDYSGSGPRPMFEHAYVERCLSLTAMRKALGDQNSNGQIDFDETPASTGSFLLWSAGPNGAFGPDPDDPMQQRSDDVTNFCQ
jgi:prepilin-type N-terminal cleavage/methylation domain-containing protein